MRCATGGTKKFSLIPPRLKKAIEKINLRRYKAQFQVRVSHNPDGIGKCLRKQITIADDHLLTRLGLELLIKKVIKKCSVYNGGQL